MKRQRGFTLIEAMIVAAIVIIMLCIFVDVVRSNPRRGCLSFGYPTQKMNGGELYCVKRVNDTDVVVRLKTLQEQDAGRIEQ